MRAEPADPSASALETDAALLQRYLSSRDRTAMDQFFQRHVGSAYRLALCIVGNSDQAEEAVQAAFVQILALKTIPANPAGWVAGVVINTCRMAVREEKRRRQREETAAMNSVHTGAAAPDAEKSELAAAAIRGVKNLPEHYRLPVWLHFLEQMSFAEIAAALSLSEGTVREQARRGLAHLRESLLAGGFMVAAIGLPELLNAAPLTPPPATLAAALKSLAASAAPHGAATMVPAMAAKAGAFSTVKLGAIAAFAVAGAALAAHFSPTLRAGGRHETRADDAPPPVAAPVQPIQPIQPGPVTVAAPKVATRDELLSKKLDVAYRRDFLIEVLRDLNDRTGIHCVCSRPIEALPQFHFTFEKKNATVKEVLEKLAAGGELQLEFHDNTAVFWKKADDAVLAELTQQLKTPRQSPPWTPSARWPIRGFSRCCLKLSAMRISATTLKSRWATTTAIHCATLRSSTRFPNGW